MKKILIASNLRPLLVQEVGFLDRDDVTVLTADTNEALLQTHIEHHVNLIITGFDLPGLGCETLFDIIRRSHGLQQVSVIIVCDGTAQARDRAKRCGANVIMTPDAPSREFGRMIQELIDIAPRKSFRIVLTVSVDGKFQNKTILCSSENLSATGLLLRTEEVLGIGDRLACTFYLPDGIRIDVEGKIVRVVESSTDAGGSLYGVRFTAIDPAARTAIETFIEKEFQYRMSLTQRLRSSYTV